jgi:hypothetical protein
MQRRQYASIPPRRSATQEQMLTRRREYADTNEPQEDDYPEVPRLPSSTLRWRDTQGNRVFQQGNRRIIIHEEPPPKGGVHWVLPLGFGMVIMVLLFIGVTAFSNWWNTHQSDATYGFPRTYQTDAIVYPGDSAAHPSHYIFLNLEGTVIIIELPHGDPAHARDYRGPTLFSDHADLIPVTGDFRQVNGKEEMLVHIQDETLIYVNDGTHFQPQR